MVTRKKRSNTSASHSIVTHGVSSRSRSKDPRLGDEHCQPSPQKDPSSPSLAKSPDQTQIMQTTSIAVNNVRADRPCITATFRLSSIAQSSTTNRSLVENGNQYNLRLKILCKKAGKNSNTSNCVVILSSAIEQIQKEDNVAKIRNVCVNVDQQLRLKSQESKLALEYGQLPYWTLRANKEVHCKYLLAAFALFERLTKCYHDECGITIKDYDTIEIAFSRIIAVIANVDDEVEQERSLMEDKKIGCKVLETIRVGDEEFKRKFMEGVVLRRHRGTINVLSANISMSMHHHLITKLRKIQKRNWNGTKCNRSN